MPLVHLWPASGLARCSSGDVFIIWLLRQRLHFLEGDRGTLIPQWLARECQEFGRPFLGRGDELLKETPLERVVLEAVPLLQQPAGYEEEDILRECGEHVVGHACGGGLSLDAELDLRPLKPRYSFCSAERRQLHLSGGGSSQQGVVVGHGEASSRRTFSVCACEAQTSQGNAAFSSLRVSARRVTPGSPMCRGALQVNQQFV